MTDFDVELQGSNELRVDLGELEDAGTTDRAYEVGTTVEYGQFLEFGTRDMPPYPWFRPAIRELEANSRDFVGSSDAVDLDGIEDARNAGVIVKAVAASLARQMERNVSADSAAGRSPGTNPEHPKRDTGTLVNSIGFSRIR